MSSTGLTTDPLGPEPIHGDGRHLTETDKESILHELEAIQNSPFFQSSKRCKQFLAYVVRHRLEGSDDRLKERTIGVDLFERPVGYSTGDDPVVRVQAGEVRRRLEQYYHGTPNHSPVRIELHVGSYAPEFKWAQAVAAELESTELPSAPQPQKAPEPDPSHSKPPHPIAIEGEPAEHAPEIRPARKRLAWAFPFAALALAAILAIAGVLAYRARAPKSALEQFWSPAFSTSEPVLICMAKPTVYVPSVQLYQRHSATPEKFLGQFERLSQAPDLQPNDTLTWKDMVEYKDYGLATGDVYAAIRLSALLGKIGKGSQVRIGDNFSFNDLRSFPAIVVGAFNNRWTMQMTSNLHFAFAEENGESVIQEEGPSGRRWRSKTTADNAPIEDYSVVTRLLNSKTGQFIVSVGGIKSYGTLAASELVSNPDYLEKALRSAPADWGKKNLQIVIETTVTDSVSGPPQVVAVYVW